MQSYGVERYEAKQVSGSHRPIQITLDVQQHEENGNTPFKGLFIHDVRVYLKANDQVPFTINKLS